MTCNKPCNNKTELNYCKTTTCIHPEMWSFIISPEKCLENNKLDTLTKGVDKTIEEIEFEINNNFVVGGTYNRLNCLLQDLKKLKGE